MLWCFGVFELFGVLVVLLLVCELGLVVVGLLFVSCVGLVIIVEIGLMRVIE